MWNVYLFRQPPAGPAIRSAFYRCLPLFTPHGTLVVVNQLYTHVCTCVYMQNVCLIAYLQASEKAQNNKTKLSKYVGK